MSHEKAAQLVLQAQASTTAADKAALLSEAGRIWESLNDLPHAAQAYYQSYTTLASVAAAEGCFRTYRAASKWPGALQWITAALSLETSLPERARLLDEKARLLQNDMGDFDAAQGAYSELRDVQGRMAEAPPAVEAPVAAQVVAPASADSGGQPAPSLRDMEQAAVTNTPVRKLVAVAAVLLIAVSGGWFFFFRSPCPEGQTPNSLSEPDGTMARGCGVGWRLQGRAQLFDRSEQLVGYATYLNGQREGAAEQQTDGGTIHANYIRGALDGQWRLTNGTAELERRSYRDGKPDGLWERFDPNHRRLHTEEWSMGQLSGFSRDYHPNGSVAVEDLFDAGQKSTPTRRFSTAGEMLIADDPRPAAAATNDVEVLASGGERVFGGHRLESWRSLVTLAALKGKQELVLTRARRAGLQVFEDGGVEP